MSGEDFVYFNAIQIWLCTWYIMLQLSCPFYCYHIARITIVEPPNILTKQIVRVFFLEIPGKEFRYPVPKLLTHNKLFLISSHWFPAMHPQTGNSVPIPPTTAPPPQTNILVWLLIPNQPATTIRIRLGAAIVMETVATRPLHAGLVLVMIMSG